MSDEDFIAELFCSIGEAMRGEMKGEKKHQQAKLYPSEIVTLAILCALKGVGNRAFLGCIRAQSVVGQEVMRAVFDRMNRMEDELTE